MQTKISILLLLCILAGWFSSDIQQNSLALSVIIFFLAAIGIFGAALMFLNNIQSKLEDGDKKWLKTAQKKLAIPIFIACGLSVLISADLAIGMFREKMITLSATRIYCRQTSNVPGLPSTERPLFNGKMCFEPKTTPGSTVYVYDRDSSHKTSIGESETLSIRTADSFFFGADAYFLSAKVRK